MNEQLQGLDQNMLQYGIECEIKILKNAIRLLALAVIEQEDRGNITARTKAAIMETARNL